MSIRSPVLFELALTQRDYRLHRGLLPGRQVSFYKYILQLYNITIATCTGLHFKDFIKGEGIVTQRG